MLSMDRNNKNSSSHNLLLRRTVTQIRIIGKLSKVTSLLLKASKITKTNHRYKLIVIV